jgi:hypothetical protein
MKTTTNISSTIHSRMRGKSYVLPIDTMTLATFLSLDSGKMGGLPSPRTRTNNWIIHPVDGSVVFGSLCPSTNDRKRPRARSGCANGTMWAAPRTVAKVSSFPYSATHPATFNQEQKQNNYIFSFQNAATNLVFTGTMFTSFYFLCDEPSGVNKILLNVTLKLIL